MDDVEKVTIREVYEALALNGFRYVRGNWVVEDVKGVANGACILGQGALNLGVEPHTDLYSLESQLNNFSVPVDSPWHWFNSGLAATIIHWNDRAKFSYDLHRHVYLLRTYKQVLKMAYDVLSPHFDKTITLRKRDWVYKRKDGTTNATVANT